MYFCKINSIKIKQYFFYTHIKYFYTHIKNEIITELKNNKNFLKNC